MKRISLLRALGIMLAATARVPAALPETEAAPDAAKLALFDSLYARQMAPAAGRTASR
jgi:hypothetical protein